MSEAVETAQETPKLYKLDDPETIVPIEVAYDDQTIELFHKLKWPDMAALNEREQQTPQETQMLSATRTRPYSADGVSANAKLWDKFRLQVRGYGWNGADADEWIDVTPELAAEIPAEHKSAAMVGLFASEFTIERPEGKGFTLGAQTYRVKQTYDDFTIYHVFGKHQESDRRQLARNAQDIQYQTETAKVKEIRINNLKPYVQFYDKFCLHLEGVTGDAPNIAQRKDLINAIWKRGAVDALLGFFGASRRVSKKN
jgi:hypothetical protein